MNPEYVAHTETAGRFTIRIIADQDAQDPRAEWDHTAHMICFHRDYNLGDKHNMSTDELSEIIRRKDVVALPLYLYDHSGITMSTGRFPMDSGGWDASLVGAIYMTRSEILKEFGKPGARLLTAKLRAAAIKRMESEVDEYDDYLTGNVYGFTVAPTDDEDNIIDSCWGFFGDYNKYVLDEARTQVKYLIEQDAIDAAALTANEVDCDALAEVSI
jgi:hypothetical protein